MRVKHLPPIGRSPIKIQQENQVVEFLSSTFAKKKTNFHDPPCAFIEIMDLIIYSLKLHR